MSAAIDYSRYDRAVPDRRSRYGGHSYEAYGRDGRYDRYRTDGNTVRREREYERTARPERQRTPDISVMPGRRQQAQSQPLPSSIIFLAKTIAVVLVVLALLGCVRITLSSATVTTALETRELSSQIDSARSEGNSLEVAQSSLSNPTRIKDAATQLGMSAPAYVATIDLSGDVVVIDAAGNLSLSGSAAVLAQG